MGTTYNLRDVGLSPGQARQEQLELELVPYLQGGQQYAIPDGMVAATLDVTAMTEGTSFRLRFGATYHGPCARCLEPASLEVAVDVHEVHDPEAEEDELRSEHVDESRLELDVTALAQEAVGLQFPTRVLCRPECRGLCAQCGVDLNENPEHGHEQPVDSRWEALRALQLEGEDTSN